MAKTISAPVGERGNSAASQINLSKDVETIQELLNNILPAFGGADPKLKVDGICGPKTKAAIVQFQLKQFGWQGADGRVDPDKQTLARMNMLAFGLIGPPVIPPGPGPSILPESARFIIHRMGTETSFAGEDIDLFFHITDMTNGFIGIYWLAPQGRQTTTEKPRMTFHGPSRSFNTKGPQTVDRLDCEAVYFSSERDGAVHSNFALRLSSGAISIAMPHHLIGPHGVFDFNPSGGASTWISGDLRFIRPG